MQKKEKSISGIEDTLEKLDSSVKENIKTKKSLITKPPGNLEHHKKNKSKNNSDKKIIPAQRHKNILKQKNQRRKLFQLKEARLYMKFTEHAINWAKNNLLAT